jgi:hypothetical protein
MTRRQLTALIVSLTAALALATSALAAGEPKNAAPFTRSTATPISVQGLAAEPKNVLPFSRTVAGRPAPPDSFERFASAHPYGRGTGAVAASTVADAPDAFERYAAAHPYGQNIASSPLASETQAANFRWRDALVGAAATAGLLLLAASILLAVSRRRRVLSTALEA